MEGLSSIVYGFGVCLEPINLFYCLLGCLIGTLIGVLPGLGPMATISLLLPVTFHLTPVAAIIMLAGIYYGAMYGGSTTSILITFRGRQLPSSPALMDTGWPEMAGWTSSRNCSFRSYIEGPSALSSSPSCPFLASAALKFGPPEYFSLMLLGFTLLAYLTSGSMIKALMMAAFGLILGCVGMDIISGKSRFTYQQHDLGRWCGPFAGGDGPFWDFRSAIEY